MVYARINTVKFDRPIKTDRYGARILPLLCTQVIHNKYTNRMKTIAVYNICLSHTQTDKQNNTTKNLLLFHNIKK